ncbi:MAG: transposase [Prevotella conceptionensis]
MSLRHDLAERRQRASSSISRIRYKVEHTFASMHRWLGAGITRYVGFSEAHAQHIMESIAYNLSSTVSVVCKNSIIKSY